MSKIDELKFKNTFASLPSAFFSRVAPTPFARPVLVAFSPNAAELLDLDSEESCRPDFSEYFSGKRSIPGSEPLAAVYAGHQFGSFVPQLGDGRAILLGEIENSRSERWDVQLKGAGATPYSRGFDGRAVLRSTIREFLCSEAMHGLGIPTTRALCIMGSDEPVQRERVEGAAMLTRLAPTHVRFGSFQYFFYRNQTHQIRELADYVIDQFYPGIEKSDHRYSEFFAEVVIRTAQLIAKWQAAGFAHGVMNTDNMSIVGVTLDYGPFGFMESFDAGLICNHSDHGGRYAFDQQPGIAFWNLQALAQALSPLVSTEDLVKALNLYQPAFADHYGELMRAKLGLVTAQPDDGQLLLALFDILQMNGVDYTRFFRALCRFRQTSADKNGDLRDMFIDPTAFDSWAAPYRERLAAEESVDDDRAARMFRANPRYILRNYLAQQAISRAEEDGDFAEIERLRLLLADPFAEQPDMDEYAQLPPDWAGRIVVSCSS